MENLTTTTDKLIEVMSLPQSTNEDINNAVNTSLECISGCNKEEVGTFMKRVFTLTSLPDIDRASFAAMFCGYLVEQGFPGDAIVEDMINLYDNFLDKSKPFFDLFYQKINELTDNGEPEKDGDSATDKLYNELLNNEDLINDDIYNAVISLDKFYNSAVSVFSVEKENHRKAKERLQSKIAYISDYSTGGYWLNKLFTVLFDEPVVVIEIDKKKGFTGKISGIAENFQLQYLLMSIPLLNDGNSVLSGKELAVANGTGEQSASKTIVSKWNMYNLEFTSQDDRTNKTSDSKYWIWNEGTPADISAHNGYRVILLGKPSYSRSSNLQRTFRNLKAGIEIERELTTDEIDQWLGLLK